MRSFTPLATEVGGYSVTRLVGGSGRRRVGMLRMGCGRRVVISGWPDTDLMGANLTEG